MGNQASQSIETVFRLIDREVWIVTSAAKDSRRGGLVATWVSQASIDSQHPMVVAAIAPNHFTAELIESSGALVAHLITADQIELAWRFALGSGRDRDKFAGLATTASDSGVPILRNCLAWLDCKVVTKCETGDRIYFLADVVAGGSNGDGQPLRERELFAAANAEQLAILSANRQADADALKSNSRLWRAKFANL